MELWKPIPKYESLYEVSNFGRVKRIAKGGPAKIGYILKPRKDACGYLRIRLCRSSKDHKMFRVHRLVLAAFIEPRGPEWTTNHKNKIRHDNRLSNLEYMTHADNVRYSSNNYSKPGELNPRAKLTEKQVLEIRRMYSLGIKQSRIARAFRASKYMVHDIVHRRCWKHL